MDQYLDFWNLMAYDYAGSWDSTAGHQANIYPSAHTPASTPFSTSVAIEYYKSRGIHPSKIVLGMPLYGRGFTTTDGPGRPFAGTGGGSWEQGVWDYKALPQTGAKEMIDQESGASWSYDPEKRMMVSYDTLEMARIKTEYVKRERLGGAMWWESSGDKQGEESLIGKVSVLVWHLDIPALTEAHRLFMNLAAWIGAITRCRIPTQSTTTCGMGFGNGRPAYQWNSQQAPKTYWIKVCQCEI